MKKLWAVIFIILAFSSKANADDHQFQMLLTTNKSDLGNYVLIIDSKTGDLWEYSSLPPTGGFGPMEGVKYLGKLKTGKEGEGILGFGQAKH